MGVKLDLSHRGRNIRSGFISVINQLDAQNFCFTISFISCLYMFRAHVLIIMRSKLQYTASGIVTAIGVMIPEAWNKLIVKQKFCASSLLITEINILRCTVSKTSKEERLLRSTTSLNKMPFDLHIPENRLLLLLLLPFVFCSSQVNDSVVLISV